MRVSLYRRFVSLCVFASRLFEGFVVDQGSQNDDLLKMNVLRKILSSMGTMDAIEFIISKLNKTKNNADFFVSMNKPS